MPNPPQYGARLRAIRHWRGLSLTTLADSSGIAEERLRDAEENGASLTLLDVARIATGLELSLPDLLDEEFEPHLLTPRVTEIDPLGFGPRVRALRERQGHSMRELASRAEVSAPMLSQIERDETIPTLRLAAMISAAFGRTISQTLRATVEFLALDLRVQAVDQALIEELVMRPELLHELQPRQFEELMAELYEREGFEVTLTQQTRDGGVDLYLVRHTSFGKLLTLVDTKRFRADRPVGVGIVRQLYGVVEEQRASAGVVATTSYFSKDAHAFREKMPFRLGLQDFRDLQVMLRRAGDDSLK